jgi:hypothetical protein
MNHPLLRAVLVVSLALTAGCASSHGGGSPDMETRTYRLRNPEVDAAVVNRVLEKEYERSGVRSSSSVTPNGDLMVQTTSRGHAAVRDALMQEGR